MNNHRARPRLVAAMIAVGLVAAACGTDDETSDAPTPDSASSATDEPTAAEAPDATDEPAPDLSSVELTSQSYLGEAAALGRVATFFYDEVSARSGGAITFDKYWDGSLVEALGIRDAVADGRLDVGQATHAYNPNDFPITTITTVPYLTSNVPAVTAALTRLYHENDAYRAEWEAQGIRLVAFLGVPPSVLGMAQPVTSLDDLAGQQIRGVDRFIAALDAVNANPVSLTAFEVYEALERGTITGYTGIPFDVVGALSLQEVAPHVVDMGQGVYAGAYIAMSLDAWNALEPAAQKLIDEVATEIPAFIGGAYEAGEENACNLFKEAGGSVSVMSDDQVQAWADAIGDSLIDKWRTDVGATGADADAIHDQFTTLLAAAEAEYSYSSGLVACADSF